jgi:transposase
MAPQDQRIAELEVQLAQAHERIRSLEEENAELRARLGQNSTNSSRPPSQDPTQLRRKPKPPSGRKRGGQPGHPRHEREPTPPDEVHEEVPAKCDLCGSALKGVDPKPLRHQFIDIVSGRRHVIEYRLHALDCRRCRHRTRASLPPGVLSWRIFGARLTAIVALLTGKYRMSKRLAQELLHDLFDVDVSLGSICVLEQDASAALATPVEEAEQHVPQQAVANMDESGWWEGQKNGRKIRAWLWVVVTASVVVFRIALSRGANVAKSLLGGDYQGILGSDRWSAYTWVDASRRQLCWSHLDRDFQGWVDRGGDAAEIGASLLAHSGRMFAWWHRIRDGTLSRAEFQFRMRSPRKKVLVLLRRAEVGADKKAAGMAKKILAIEEALFTFVDHEGVEPTNNSSERQIRPGVLWRNVSFGTQSDKGSRFVERILTTVATLKKQRRPILEFLVDAINAHSLRKTAPSLLPPAQP